MYLHYMETHQPWLDRLPREFTGAFCSRREGRSDGAIFQDDQKLIKRVFSVPFEEVTDDQKVRLDEIYDEAVAYVDLMIGRTLSVLRARRDPAETLVIFTSDHGDELFDHKRLGHAHTVYQELTRVPLVMRAGGVAPGRTLRRVSNVNIYETIKAFVCPQDQKREPVGEPLVGPSGRDQAGDEIVFSQLCPPIPEGDCSRMTKVVRRDLTAGIVKEDSEGGVLAVQRYDLKADPLERRPLPEETSGAFAEEAARFTRDYAALARKHDVVPVRTLARWQRTYSPDQEEEVESRLTEKEKQLRDQLKALGYIGH